MGEKARAKEGDDRRGQAVSEREQASARVGRVAGPTRVAGPRERVTQASEQARAGTGASAWMGHAVGPSQRMKGEAARSTFFVFFFKNVNSHSIYLFQ
jgi:hypothetical protein